MVTNAGQITIRDSGLAARSRPASRTPALSKPISGRYSSSSTAAFTVDLYGDGLFNFTLDKQVTQAITKLDGTKPTAAVTNTGGLIADGGKILLTANAASSVVSNAINMSGYGQATTAKVTNGEIVLDGGTDGTVEIAGTLNASGTGSGQTGGTVQVTGNDVNVAATAKIDVSGSAGGGTALIGGDMHGGGTLRRATTTTVASGATIKADAISSGNGGEVVVWSDEQTNYQGKISAQGGTTGGNGGSVEVSSHELLNFNGTVDLRAPYGQIGTLLLDPENVTIVTTGDTPSLSGLSSGSITLSANADDSVLSVSTLQNALALANVTVSTGSTGSQAGDITVSSPVSWSSANSLTLSANRNIAVNANITNTGSAAVVLRADNTGTGIGVVSFGSGNTISTSGAISIFYNPSVNPAGSVVNTTSYVNPTENYSGVIAGGGTLTAYMLVNSVFDLQNIQNNLSGNYALGGNIDASGIFNFVPIGGNTAFSGTFDGLGHAISNLTIDLPSSNEVGLFGATSTNATIRNVTVTNANVIGFDEIGALVGLNNGAVVSSNVSGVVLGSLIESGGPCSSDTGGLVGYNSGTISDSSASVTVASGQGVGGLVGTNWGTIQRSFATGSVSGAQDSTGGLVGGNGGIVSQSYATGSVYGAVYDVGGLVGDNLGTVSDSYATGNVSGSYENIGGFAGENDGLISTSYSTGAIIGGTGFIGITQHGGSESNSYWDMSTSGVSSSNGGTGLTTAQFMDFSNFYGFDFNNIWVIIDSDGTLNNSGGASGATRPFLVASTRRQLRTHISFN